MVWHATDAWSRRHEPNVVLAHYADLSADLEGEMRRLADRLGITVPEDRWPELVQAATFDDMRARAQLLAPDPAGIMKDRDAFFRRGTSGAGEEVLSPEELAHYRERVAELGPPEVVAWLHHGRRAGGGRCPSEAPRRPASAERGGQLEAGVAVGRTGVVELDRDDVGPRDERARRDGERDRVLLVRPAEAGRGLRREGEGSRGQVVCGTPRPR